MTKLKEQELVEEFVNVLSGHDWYYDYADDFSVFERGLRSKKKIMDLFKQVMDLGMDPKAAVDIYNQHAPKNYKLNTNDIG